LDLKPVTTFARAVEALQPGAGGRSIVKLLDGKAKRHAILNWRAGRRQAPQWALQLLARKIRERAAELATVASEAHNEKERLGLSAGALNLAKWRARPK
jgi:hypothetical protein